jgi:Leucine-rich repeat (LRR) protein
MEETVLQPPTQAEIDHYHSWWSGLTEEWKKAFNEVMLNRSSSEDLPLLTLHQIWTAPALRFAGPTAPYPNMTFELDNIDGVLGLPKLEIFVFTFHQLKSLKDIGQLPNLKSLFVFNNQIGSLDGVEALSSLQELYFNANKVHSLQNLANLTQLRTIYCTQNELRSLEGVGVQHLPALKDFFCVPNDFLPQSEIIRMEREVGIICRKG